MLDPLWDRYRILEVACNSSRDCYHQCIINYLELPQQKLYHLKNLTKNKLHYFDDKRAKIILNEYLNLFQKKHTENETITELTSGKLYTLCNDAKNWTVWRQTIEQWIEELKLIYK